MRAGRLDREIQILAFSSTVQADGTPVEHWALVATVRAQLVEATTEEYQRAYGEGGSTSVIFRMRWIDGVTVAHRVDYQGRALNIRETKEIGRRRGLELRCEEVRS